MVTSLGVPLSQSDSRQLDQISHTGSDDYWLLVGVAGLIVAFHLLHHKLSVAQQRVFSEAVEVQSCRRYGCLQAAVRAGQYRVAD